MGAKRRKVQKRQPEKAHIAPPVEVARSPEPRPRATPKLKLRHRDGRESIYYIHHGSVQISTKTSNQIEAEAVYLRYQISIVQMRSIAYQTDPFIKDLMAEASQKDSRLWAEGTKQIRWRADRRLRWYWGMMRLSDINVKTCEEYLASRRKELLNNRPLSNTTLNIEMGRLKYLVNTFCEDRGYNWRPKFEIPDPNGPRSLYASPREIALLIRALRTWKNRIRDQGELSEDSLAQIARLDAVIRFILIAIYTGTRRNAILDARWKPNMRHGFIDLEKGIYYRRGKKERDSQKRRPPVRLCNQLIRFTRGWAASDRCNRIDQVVHELNGSALRESTLKYYLRRGSRAAGLGRTITAHTLRHTCATWLLRSGLTLEKVAKFLGITVAVLERTYAEVRPAFSRPAAEALSKWGSA